MNREDFITLRKYYDLTQQEIAEIIGVHRVTVAQWECGMRQLTDIKLKKIILKLKEEFGDS
ncbi:MAG: helix-turn-helix transcriptional regulator [Asgard group archaeon]|nr:helix-turn-helix transcriptional regulator [Asgard group archaeon]